MKNAKKYLLAFLAALITPGMCNDDPRLAVQRAQAVLDEASRIVDKQEEGQS